MLRLGVRAPPPEPFAMTAVTVVSSTPAGALWHEIKNMNETYVILENANGRLNEFKSRFQTEVLKRLTKMDKQVDVIEETVNDVRLGDEEKIMTLETQFKLAYDEASRTENAINRFRRDFETELWSSLRYDLKQLLW